MKTRLLFLLGIAALIAISGSALRAQESKPTAPDKPQSSETKPSEPKKPKLTQEELEAKFKATMTKATLSGRWCGIKDGKLTPEKEDKYTIIGVSKIGNDAWLVHARIQYGQRDFTVPLPVQVKWAGDTAVITVDDMTMPNGGNSYSARVLIYDKTYAGTWSGGNHAGLMNGIITNEKE